ncbi:hypothetical protein SCHPADRAFT_941286 [Schizopora paradoxa]|uniref:DUF4336 domain-containing protein n=1 Tax=Schizopora paradoxa TaxID=27342 RepID=A0A0H2RL62_9AGAM|nr:hypothetical protein SCHPADRAFT_941286 [Schizopora paradoxa]
MAGSEVVIREVTPGIVTFSKPFTRLGVLPFGGRSTAVKLADGGVWLLASTPLTDATKKKLEELGDVKYIVGPDAVHNLYLPEYKSAYPAASLIGVVGHLTKPNLASLSTSFVGVYGRDDASDASKFGYTKDNEIEAVYFSGFKNQDVAFLHRASRTLIVADLLLNLPAKEQYSAPGSGSPNSLVGNGLKPGTWYHRWMIGTQAADKKAMQRDAKTVAGWDFDRIIMCHGDVIETEGKKAWTETYQNFLV